MRKAALTICAINYIPKALVLIDSYLLHHPKDKIYILIVDRKSEIQALKDLLQRKAVRVIWIEDLGIQDFLNYAFMYDVIEFNTNVKPFALRKILNQFDVVVYLDPDIKIYSPLTPVFDALQSAAIVVTPHSNTPIMDGAKPDDVDLLKFGVFNLGFIAVSKSPEAFIFLEWWSERCLKMGFYEPHLGLAVDQKWINLAPGFFPSLKVLHDVGLNVAFWNLHERQLSKQGNGWVVNNDTTLRFVHFSSFDPHLPNQIAHKQDRFPRGSRPDFVEIAEDYSKELFKNSNQELSSFSYGFDYFDNGLYVTPSLRRFYASLRDSFFLGEKNPFSSDGEVMKFARKHSLVSKNNQSSQRKTFRDVDRYNTQIKLINKMLRFTLFVLGPERYFNLMRYLAHISSLLNQAGLFIDKP